MSSLVRYDPLLFESQDNAWRGLVSYYQHGGAEGDPWGGAPSTFRERNTSYVPLAYNQHLKIFETCNFASNIAYYHMNIALARWVLHLLDLLDLLDLLHLLHHLHHLHLLHTGTQ